MVAHHGGVVAGARRRRVGRDHAQPATGLEPVAVEVAEERDLTGAAQFRRFLQTQLIAIR